MADIPHSDKYRPSGSRKRSSSPRSQQRQGGYSSQTRNRNAQSSNNKNDGCFIATAVYGSYNNPSVIVLRAFRDQFLQRSVIGEKFVLIYYKVSPCCANWLVDKPILKKVTKFFLSQFVKLVALFVK